MNRCSSMSPTETPRAQCALDDGHDGIHRVNLLTWHDPFRITVDGREPDPTVDSDHWIDGHVYLAGDEPPL